MESDTIMQRLQLDTVGPPAQALSLLSAADPSPSLGEVLVEIEAAPVNPSDLLYISGAYILRPKPPAPVGAEGVGRVTAVGPEVDHALIGRRVLLLPTYRHGTWATHTIAQARDVVAMPEDVDVLQLAMLGINAMTALQLLRRYGNPTAPNRWIGQTAGNSAVGEYIVKLAKSLGHNTISIVRREAAAEQVRSWNGDRVIIDGDRLNDDLTTALQGAKLDIALDSVGGPTSTALAGHLGYEGTLISYGTQSGQPPTIATTGLLGNHARLTGFWLMNWLNHTAHEEIVHAYEELAGLVANGTISAAVQHTMRLDEWPKALSLAAESRRTGKILFVKPPFERNDVSEQAHHQ
jgi:mitochondrial enoyl-[acyl-carrier protein] reductase / trans-2-enoyl-CoA reductase